MWTGATCLFVGITLFARHLSGKYFNQQVAITADNLYLKIVKDKEESNFGYLTVSSGELTHINGFKRSRTK